MPEKTKDTSFSIKAGTRREELDELFREFESGAISKAEYYRRCRSFRV